MKKLLIILTLTFSFSLFAGPGHEHSHGGHGHSHASSNVSKEKTVQIGMTHINRLVKLEKLDKSWLKAKYEKTIKKTFGKRKEWVVTFDNVKSTKGKKLYIFLKLSGRFLGANFTGK